MDMKQGVTCSAKFPSSLGTSCISFPRGAVLSSLIQGTAFREPHSRVFGGRYVCVCACPLVPLWAASLLTPSNKTVQAVAIGASDRHNHKLILVF